MVITDHYNGKCMACDLLNYAIVDDLGRSSRSFQVL